VTASTDASMAREQRGWEALARSAAAPGEEAESDLLRELLSFVLGDAIYAIPVERVREIVRIRTITPMPRVPACVLGVIALRGEVVQVVDIRQRVSGDVAETGRRSRIIVLHGDDERVAGILVDGVREVLRLPDDAISPSTSGDSEYVDELCRNGDDFVSILEIDRVLDLE
jgi:purine-binding chemotaxis protein CheW